MSYADSKWPPVQSEVQRLSEENRRLHSMARGDLRRLESQVEENRKLRASIARLTAVAEAARALHFRPRNEAARSALGAALKALDGGES